MASVLTGAQLLDEMILECNITKHLHSKLSADMADYRPTEGQRSILELLRYVSVCGIASTTSVLSGSITTPNDIWKRSAEMTFDEFPAAMDRQIDELNAALGGLSDEELATRTATYFFGPPQPIGYLLVKATLKWLTAYRMQLFLYAKGAGVPGLVTLNNWVGMDAPPAAADEAEEAALEAEAEAE